MFEIGMICVKLAGREAGRKCVVVKHIDNNFVMIDGDVKRRKCNVDHLMPLDKTIAIKASTASEAIKDELIKIGLMVKKDKKSKPKKEASERPTKVRPIKEKPLIEKKAPVKKTAPKEPVVKAKPAVKKTVPKKAPAKKVVVKKAVPKKS
ncbi:MAG: 50S ribosomal protein L14e [Candidatus Nanoarchaeia archaeon]|jgi:large subunit ribosomal protein L14e